MPQGERAFLAMGSNLGDRAGYLATARKSLARIAGTRVIAVSSEEETAPLGGRDQPPYLNQMILVETVLSPRGLLEACLAIEREAGRERGERWGSRTLDIDIVRYGSQVVNEPDLRIPHPGLADRDFWRREMAEIEGKMAAR
jgi:2-amino-4-hydroxy-6-hydroxymethyldihydropteridine diphosphokinase